jgi:hypothetical protein
MKTPTPISRAQQVTGMPEHPCETIVRNGALICPYEEMEIRFFEQHAGLYLLTLVGEPFEIFGWGERRARTSLLDGYLPVIRHEATQKGCALRQTVFACLLNGEDVVTGEEPLINLVELEATNVTAAALELPVTLVFGSCFRAPTSDDGQGARYYWKDFLCRDDIAADVAADEPLPPYPFALRQTGHTLVAAGKGIVFCADAGPAREGAFAAAYGRGAWKEGTSLNNGWRVILKLGPGETKTLRYKIPYLPLPDTADNRRALDRLVYAERLEAYRSVWNRLLGQGSLLDVPGTRLKDLWRAQTAATFILVDKQNKGDPRLFGGEMYAKWTGGLRYPDRLLSYVHLSPSLYEFIWAQEAAYWVVGMLDLQGYHDQAEDYFEMFFALQGRGTPGVHDPAILPPDFLAFMGTTPHAWLNNNGGVLVAMAEHYKLTRNKAWIHAHQEAILSACRWVDALRKTTKTAQRGNGFGLMPPGQSTDATFASDHLQWYYTDIWTLLGLKEMAQVLKDCGVAGADELIAEARDYQQCFLRSLDASIRPLADFKEQEADYDYSCHRFYSALKDSAIDDRDAVGVPVKFKGKVLLKADAERAGLRLYVPMSPQATIPFKPPYLDGGYVYALGLLSGLIDYTSDEPLFPGARHSGRDVWEGIEGYCRVTEVMDIPRGIFTVGLPYNDYIIKKLLHADQAELVHQAVDFVLRYGCDPETFMGKETAGSYLQEMWFQPCPFTLSMAAMRKWLRNMLVYEDDRDNRLVIGKALPKEWFENAASHEAPIAIERTASYYGPVSASYRIDFSCSRVEACIQLHDPKRFPAEVEVRFANPRDLPVKNVKLNGTTHRGADAGGDRLRYCPRRDSPDGRMRLVVEFDPA